MAAKAKKKAKPVKKAAAKKAVAKAPKKAKAAGPEISSDLRKVALAHALRRLQ
ncbi:MAG: hypothetical protein FJ091_16535 [Deltaproteobacteria bacterium]|nr:hypothetical protein [Deltaproteobacteria bacterium]